MDQRISAQTVQGRLVYICEDSFETSLWHCHSERLPTEPNSVTAPVHEAMVACLS
jgi:hypothetical protein